MAGKLLIELLRDEGHEGMQQLHGGAQHFDEDRRHVLLLRRALPVQGGLGHLDVPVAELSPDEVVDLLRGQIQFVIVQIVRHLPGDLVETGQDPLVGGVEQLFPDGGLSVLRDVHEHEPCCVVHLVAEVPGGLHLLPVEAHVVAGGVAGDQGEAQGVCAVLFDDLERIDAVAQGLAHLPAQAVPHEAVDVYVFKGRLLHDLHTEGDHAAHPEGDDVVAGHQGRGGIEVVELRRLFRPAQGREGPETGGEPGVQHVLVLPKLAAVFGALLGGGLLTEHAAAVVTVVHGDAMAPPELA